MEPYLPLLMFPEILIIQVVQFWYNIQLPAPKVFFHLGSFLAAKELNCYYIKKKALIYKALLISILFI
jgi:hypothetical protein